MVEYAAKVKCPHMDAEIFEGCPSAARIQHGQPEPAKEPFMKKFRSLIASVLAAGAAIATPALAHPKLVTAQPADKAATAPTNRITLTFSEPLVAAVSGMEVTMTGMPGMPNHNMKMTGYKTSVSEDGKTLVATFGRPLMAGTYSVQWHVVSSDTHRINGTLAFTVR
jgi:methionine-rich copper-binding protein CopC